MNTAKRSLSLAVCVLGFAFGAMEYRGRSWEMAAFGGLVGVLAWLFFSGYFGDWLEWLYPRGPDEHQDR